MSSEDHHQKAIRQSIDNCKAGRAHQISYTSVCTPVVGAGAIPRSLLPCAKFTGPRLVTSCNTPIVGSQAGRETTQVRGPVEHNNRGASFSRKRVFSLDLAQSERCRGGGLQPKTLTETRRWKRSHGQKKEAGYLDKKN